MIQPSVLPRLDWRTKGLPPAAEGCAPEELASLGLNLLAGDLMMPAAVLKEAALYHNIAAMQAFADLVRRAQQQGELRADFTRADLDLVLTANAGFEHWNPATRRAATRRFADVVLRAFRTRPTDPVVPQQ